ncbi:MAG TPA: hypothetical protein VGY56_14220 [Verrucomicrobiae bacterium]|nr:hypothetical protein [Verrucomicrobiae bacterium]
MSLSVEQIAEEALALPGEARARLADRLVESLDPVEDKVSLRKTFDDTSHPSFRTQCFTRLKRNMCSLSRPCTAAVNRATGAIA